MPILIILLSWMVGVPLVMLAISSVRPNGFPLSEGWTLTHYSEIFLDGSFYKLIGNTVTFAAGATVIAMIFGIFIAWLVERTDVPLRRAIRAFVILPMAAPPMLLAVGWTLLLNPRNGFFNLLLKDTFGLASVPFNIYSMAGMIFVEGLSLVPSTFLLLSPSFRNIDPALEEAAAASGATTRMMMWRIALPLIRPALLGTCMFLVIASFVVFDVPGTLGMPARIDFLSTRIYRLLSLNPSGLPDYGGVSAMAVLFLGLLVVLAFGYQRAMGQAGRYVTLTGKGFRARQFKLGGWKWAALACVMLYFFLAVIAPLGMLLWTSFMPYQVAVSKHALSLVTLANHRAFLKNVLVVSAAWNSGLLAVASATAVAILSMLVSWVVVRTKIRGRKVIDVAAFLPLAIPGVMLSVALIYVYLTLSWLQVYGTIWIIAIAYVTTYLSFGSRAMNSVMMQTHPDLEDAGKTSGAGRFRILRRISVPLLAPALIAVWIWVAAHALRELASALMLQGLNNLTIPVLLWGYWSGGEPNKAAAVGVWLVAILIVLVVGWQILAERSNPRTRG